MCGPFPTNRRRIDGAANAKFGSIRVPPGLRTAHCGAALRLPRTRSQSRPFEEETACARKELWDRTAREIDELAAKAHSKLPREAATAIGAIYARYSSRHQDSVADQVRVSFSKTPCAWGSLSRVK